MLREMKRLAVLTSGGDAAGMNAAIRSVVRTAILAGCEVLGVHRGYTGLITGDIAPLTSRDVGGIMQRGGTMLGSSRSEEFMTDEGRDLALRQIERFEIEGLVVIGGNGTQKGSFELSARGVPVVGVASTIDNDIPGFDITLGADTALNIALEAIDRLKTTASSHERAFLVEVMGRDHGYLALMAGLAGGAEVIVLPECDMEPIEIAKAIRAAYDHGKPHAIVVVAEGAEHNGAELERHFADRQRELGYELRLTKLGHVQRGGQPTFADRALGLRSGYEATRLLLAGEHGVVVGQRDGELVALPLSEVASQPKPLDLSLLDLNTDLAI
jgi:6-phosphofructokinase 1